MRIKMLLNLIKVCRSTDVLYYLVDVLKLNSQKNHVYRLKSGLKIYIRNGTSDRGEMLSIISGEEYGSLLNYFKKYSREHLTIIDAGANIGLFSLFIYKHFNLRKTILIEPDEENLDSLYKNIKMNNLSNKQCKIYKNALYKNNSILLFDDALDYHARRISNRGKKK